MVLTEHPEIALADFYYSASEDDMGLPQTPNRLHKESPHDCRPNGGKGGRLQRNGSTSSPNRTSSPTASEDSTQNTPRSRPIQGGHSKVTQQRGPTGEIVNIHPKPTGPRTSSRTNTNHDAARVRAGHVNRLAQTDVPAMTQQDLVEYKARQAQLYREQQRKDREMSSPRNLRTTRQNSRSQITSALPRRDSHNAEKIRPPARAVAAQEGRPPHPPPKQRSEREHHPAEEESAVQQQAIGAAQEAQAREDALLASGDPHAQDRLLAQQIRDAQLIEQRQIAAQHENQQQHQSQQQQGGFLSAVGSLFSHGEPSQSKHLQHIQYLQRQCWLRDQQLGVERSNNESLHKDLRDLKEENDQFRSELREMQVKSFKEIVKVTWTPVEDTQVRDILSDLHKELEDWADEYGLKELPELLGKLTEEEEDNLLDYMGRISLVKSRTLGGQVRRWDADQMDPVLLLTAVLSHMMYDSVFSNTFLPLDGLLNAELQGRASTAMSEVFTMLHEMNPKPAHQWRTLLMRALLPSPPSGGRFEHISPARSEVLPFIRAYCESCITEIETSFPRAFLITPQLSHSARTQLTECWLRAAELFIQLQTQLSQTVWSDPNKISFPGRAYDAKSKAWVQAHRCQAFPEGRVDGKPISLVIAPYVAFIGNDDGERYGSSRVVSKAVVLVGEGDLLEFESEEDGDEAVDDSVAENSTVMAEQP